MTVRTRFAPSPTGYLHIGGVRTALFNWLFARQHQGVFVLRIDDTDQERNLEAALAPILEGFRWLGLNWDEGPGVEGDFGPYFQSQRGDHYRAAALELVAKGFAYWDYATTEELAEEREQAKAAKAPRFVYSRRFMAESEADRSRFEAEGRKGVIRLKMPREGACTFEDAVRGSVSFDWELEQDHVIQRADGSCLYHLASVVDDEFMKITHVIRAEEHLSNTPRQRFIAEGLGYTPPIYAHLPFVAEPGSKTKLSKRKLSKYLKHQDFAKLNEHGLSIMDRLGRSVESDLFNPVLVDFYREVGFIPDALNNYLALLGWSIDDKREDFTREELIQLFDLSRVGHSAASFDPTKLLAIQQRKMDAMSTNEKSALCQPYVEAMQWSTELLPKVVEAAGDRITVAGDITQFDFFLAPEEQFSWDEKAFQKRLIDDQDALPRLEALQPLLNDLSSFESAAVEKTVKEFLEAREIKIGKFIHALRVAVTGSAKGLGMFESMEILGKDRCLSRIQRSIERAKQEVGS